MININDVKVLSYDLAAKQERAFPSPDEFNSYANLASLDLFNYYNDERNKMLLRVKSGESLKIPQVLNNFVLNDVSLTLTSGSASVPSNYAYDLAFKTPVNSVNKTIIKVDFDKVESYLNSTIDPPTATNPIFIETANNFQIYPTTITPALLTYLKYPDTVVWGYSMATGRPVYDPTTSVNFEWPESELFRLTARILGYMGISIRDSELERYAQQQTQIAS
jgi:hypothetical protein